MVRNILNKIWSTRTRLAKVMPLAGMLAVGVVAYLLGRGMKVPAQPPRDDIVKGARQAIDGDQEKRVVAYIYENIPITRQELGEFLIARFGAERLEFLVNRRIVEMECKSRNIWVTDAQIEAQLDQDLRSLSAGAPMSRKDFETHVLKRFSKTLYEWKEDVIRPKLMLAQLVEPEIRVTEEDLRKGFEGRYGPKVECRWLVIPDDKHKGNIWAAARSSPAEFDRLARTQSDPQLAQTGGKVPPVHKHFGDANIERAALSLKEGEVSEMIELPNKSLVILKCERRIDADPTKSFDQERVVLLREIHNLKLSQRIPEKVAELRNKAKPQLYLRNETRQQDLERRILPEIQGQAAPTTQATPVSRVGG